MTRLHSIPLHSKQSETRQKQRKTGEREERVGVHEEPDEQVDTGDRVHP